MDPLQFDIPKLNMVKSANIIKLDLNYKMSKKSEIKLLNAKIRTLKNKCKALRQESKTDREILSNLMNTTCELQTKTHSGMQACKQVSTQLFENQPQSMSVSTDQNINQTPHSNDQLALESNCNQEKEAESRKQLEQMERILDSLALEKYSKQQKDAAIYDVPTERSMTASMKSEGKEMGDISLDGLLVSGTQNEQKHCESFRRANTISFSPSKISKVQRRSSLQQNFQPNKNTKSPKPESYNMFASYIYAVIFTAVLTIIFFKVIF